MGKLTKPQKELLDSLPTPCAESYAPAMKLVAIGLAKWERGTLGDRLVRASPAPDTDRGEG